MSFMLFASSDFPAFARQDRGAAIISGRVSPALKLSLGSGLKSPYGARAVIESSGLDFIQIELSGNEYSDASQMTIPLEMRTNVGYELKLALHTSSGCRPDLAASIGSIQASGAAVIIGAAETSRRADEVDLSNLDRPLRMLLGPRISARGSFASAGNALLVNLDIAIAESQKSGCSWRASLRISLHPAA